MTDDHGGGRRAGHRQGVAQIEGYTVAGKTGTASKLVNGRYSKSDYNASFVGFVPSRKPALTIVVVIDSPHAHGYYGATVSAPIFKRIAEAALQHLGVGPNDEPAAAGDRRAQAAPKSGRTTGACARAAPIVAARRAASDRTDAGPARLERTRGAADADPASA